MIVFLDLKPNHKIVKEWLFISLLIEKCLKRPSKRVANIEDCRQEVKRCLGIYRIYREIDMMHPY